MTASTLLPAGINKCSPWCSWRPCPSVCPPTPTNKWTKSPPLLCPLPSQSLAVRALHWHLFHAWCRTSCPLALGLHVFHVSHTVDGFPPCPRSRREHIACVALVAFDLQILLAVGSSDAPGVWTFATVVLSVQPVVMFMLLQVRAYLALCIQAVVVLLVAAVAVGASDGEETYVPVVCEVQRERLIGCGGA